MKPFFISIPHAGEDVPPDLTWLQELPEPVLMCDVDRYVDVLYQPVLDALKLPSVIARGHRYVVDLNRLPQDHDCDAVEGCLNKSGSFRSGIHWVKTSRDHQLIKKPMTLELHQALIKRYFEPFHQSMRATIDNLRKIGGTTIYHIDAHSMPSKGEAMHRDAGQDRAQIVVSDFLGRSSGVWFKDLVMQSYRDAGFEVSYNWPYIGGRITEAYGKPSEGQHTIQVELNRSLYMDEETKHLLPDQAKQVKQQLQQAITAIWQQLPEIKK